MLKLPDGTVLELTTALGVANNVGELSAIGLALTLDEAKGR